MNVFRSLPPFAVTVLVVLVLLAGCGSDSGAETADPVAPTTTTVTTAVPDPDLAVDWANGGKIVELANGWTIGPCESGPRQLCIRDGDETLGALELLDSPLATFTVVRDVLDEGGSVVDALEAHAEDFVSVITEDRALGCGERYELTAATPQPAEVGGADGLQIGFDASLAGEPVERAVQWTAIDGDSVWIAAITAVEPGTCGDDAHILDLDLAQLAEVEDELAAIVANSPLPEPSMCVAPDSSSPVPCAALGEPQS